MSRMPLWRCTVLLCMLAIPRLGAAEPADSQEALIKQRVYAALAPDDKAGFVPVRAPGPTDWLEHPPRAAAIHRRLSADRPARPTAER